MDNAERFLEGVKASWAAALNAVASVCRSGTGALLQYSAAW